MKHLTYLLFWLSVLTLSSAAYAADVFLPATSSPTTLPTMVTLTLVMGCGT
ncbi:hypothetical protein [Leptolyngbya ohadii]|uniref:hypothetical protein n=1 Tax=Leptolyngbya ohadii TaxID=1962290 RepID=UPI0015C67E43|nr:hypothetical protein [Leptolyngbya ohadii]